MKKSTFGVIVGTRGFFNPILAKDGRKVVTEKLTAMGYDYVILAENEAKYGCVETREDAAKCAELFKANKDKISGIIITLPNFGDEIGATDSVKLAGLDVPILVHAFDDELDKLDVKQRRDSFCGKMSVCNNLFQYGIKYTNTTYHTTSVESKIFEDDILKFDKICKIFKGLKGARIAQFGTRPGAFKTVRYSEKLLERSGITVVPVDMSDIFARASRVNDKELINKCITDINAYGKVDCTGYDCDVNSGLEKSARFTIAVEEWMKENECVAGAIQCWDSIQMNYHCASCLTMSMLGERGVPIACETDISGVIAMYALGLANESPAGYMDWNNNFGDDRDVCICFHCSAHPKSFLGIKPTISCQDVLGASLGYNNCFGAIKGQVQEGNFTFGNIATNDFEGNINMYVGEGQFANEPVDMAGSPAVCRIENLQNLMNHLCKKGFDHHIAMSRGNSADLLAEVFGNYFGWNVYRHR